VGAAGGCVAALPGGMGVRGLQTWAESEGLGLPLTLRALAPPDVAPDALPETEERLVVLDGSAGLRNFFRGPCVARRCPLRSGVHSCRQLAPSSPGVA